MKFSIVTNAYNQGKFLRRALESVLRGGYSNLEYIVIDPGSTDETPEILREYESRHDHRLTIIRERDNGPADGLNKGFERATGDWFCYLNADDFYLPGGLVQAAAAISAYPEADCLYGDGYITDAFGKPLRRVLSTPFSAVGSLQNRTLVLQQSTFYRAASFRKVGGFNTVNRTSWDYEILVDMSLAGMNLTHVPGYWSAFAIHSDSITGSQRHAAESRKNHERIFRKVMGRDRTSADLRRRSINSLLYRFSHPHETLMRIIDEKFPSRLPDIVGNLPLVTGSKK